jgi:hypothetical protein
MKKEILAWWNNLRGIGKLRLYTEYIRISRNVVSFYDFDSTYEYIQRMYHEKNTYIDCD